MPDTPAPPCSATAPVDAVVLAAGRSRRMGTPKPLLWIDGETFIERTVRTLAAGGCREVVVVVGRGVDRIPALARAAGARYVVNPAADAEQVDSLRLGLDALADDAAAAVFQPVDQPLVRRETVAAVVAAFREHGAPVVRPAHGGRTGHPTLVARPLFTEFFRGPLPRGAQTVLHRHADAIHDVAVDDPGAVTDIDTPEDYRRYVERA